MIKKKIYISITLLVLSLTVLLAMTACEKQADDTLQFTSNGDGTCFVSGIGTSQQADLVIPEVSPEGDRVTGIGNFAFTRSRMITSVTVPDGVTYIGDGAFYQCDALLRIVIPETVEQFGTSAFYGCRNLQDVKIPSRVTEISEDLFYGCSRLASLTLPDKIEKIGDHAFHSCVSLKTVNFPDSLQYVGADAFYGCSSLKSLLIPSSVRHFGLDAFYQCTGLEKVEIFDLAAWCDTSFGNRHSNPLYYAERLYINGEEVTELSIPEGVANIKDYAFVHASGIASVQLPQSLLRIGMSAFYDCHAITDVYFKITREAANDMDVGTSNEPLTSAALHFPEDETPDAESEAAGETH